MYVPNPSDHNINRAITCGVPINSLALFSKFLVILFHLQCHARLGGRDGGGFVSLNAPQLLDRDAQLFAQCGLTLAVAGAVRVGVTPGSLDDTVASVMLASPIP